jgi:Tfp pilus assembly protein PilX
VVKNFKNLKNQKGQAVLVVLLSLSVVLVITLYIMSRTITDVSLTTKDEDALRAFSAAEAGVEQALVIGNSSNSDFNGGQFSASVTEFGTGETTVTYPLSLKSGEIATFWFARPNETGFNGRNIKLCWAINSSEPPAIEATIYYKNTLGEYKIARRALDPDATRLVSNNFSSALTSNCQIGTATYLYQQNIDLSGLGIVASDTLQYMTVKFLYNTNVSHRLALDVSTGNSGSIMPSQGVIVNSSGSFGDSNRSIEVYQLYSNVPSVFMNAFYSSTDIIKLN